MNQQGPADHFSKVCIPFFGFCVAEFHQSKKLSVTSFKNCVLLTLLSAGPALTLSIALLPAQKVQKCLCDEFY